MKSIKVSNEKGITLVTLVVTIIIILILAGITIAMLTGDNGIIKKSLEARDVNNDAQELEMVQVAVQSALVDGEGIINKKDLAKELNVKENELEENNNSWIYVSKNKNYYYISYLGDIVKSKGIAYSNIKVGKTVSGYTGSTRDNNNQIKEWKVYYVDELNKYVYLISTNITESDNLANPSPKITNLAGDGLEKYLGTQQLQSVQYGNRFRAALAGLLNVVTNSDERPVANVSTMGVMRMEYMLDSYNWKSYVSTNALWAIGGPTAELLDMSLEQEANQTGVDSARITSKWVNEAGSGYNLSSRGTLSETSVSRAPEQYFIAASFGDGNVVWAQNLYTYGTKVSNQYNNNFWGIRPVVCLKQGISLYDDGNGGYTLNEKN